MNDISKFDKNRRFLFTPPGFCNWRRHEYGFTLTAEREREAFFKYCAKYRIYTFKA